ncbi:MAG: hypothetical protein QXL17_07420 [Candidatus Thermoplasmatota archaeon]
MTSYQKRTIKHLYLRSLLFLMAGAIMIGHGTRMMYQGLFHPDSYYPAPTPQTLDFYFDWLTLLLLGICILTYAFYTWYKYLKRMLEKHNTYGQSGDDSHNHQPT